MVRVIVARQLVPLGDLIDAYQWAGNNLWEIADELWVTPAVLWDRLTHLDAKERHVLDSLG